MAAIRTLRCFASLKASSLDTSTSAQSRVTSLKDAGITLRASTRTKAARSASGPASILTLVTKLEDRGIEKTASRALTADSRMTSTKASCSCLAFNCTDSPSSFPA